MKVSTKVEYGLIALTDIAIHSEKGKSVSTAEISERQNISQKYLEQILPLLRQAGFIKAQKGKRGGYKLSVSMAEVSMSDVFNALDGSILAEMYGENEEQKGELAPVINDCLWRKINRYLIEFASNLTLEEFVFRCRDSISGGWNMYVI